MRFRLFEKRKKKKDFEKMLQELDMATALTDDDLKKPQKVEQYVVERLEQVIDIAREIDEEKSEYQVITQYLNDIQKLQNLSEEERKKIEETAANVVQLNTARNGFLNSAKKLTDAQFAQMEREEENVPAAIRRLSSNESYQETLEKDMRYLEREKSRWILHRDYLTGQQKSLKNTLYILLGVAAVTAVMFGVLQLLFRLDMYYAWMILLFLAAISICGVYLKILGNDTEIRVAERNANKAIVLLNKIKLKYANIKNAVDYACEKYHVRKAADLEKIWEYYMEAVKEREKYERTNEDLEYFNGRLIRALAQYKLHDTKIWIAQAQALVNPKELVEIKHNLIRRRQKLREHMESNIASIRDLKKEAQQMADKAGDMKPQIQEIIKSINRLGKTL